MHEVEENRMSPKNAGNKKREWIIENENTDIEFVDVKKELDERISRLGRMKVELSLGEGAKLEVSRIRGLAGTTSRMKLSQIMGVLVELRELCERSKEEELQRIKIKRNLK